MVDGREGRRGSHISLLSLLDMRRSCLWLPSCGRYHETRVLLSLVPYIAYEDHIGCLRFRNARRFAASIHDADTFFSTSS